MHIRLIMMRRVGEHRKNAPLNEINLLNSLIECYK